MLANWQKFARPCAELEGCQGGSFVKMSSKAKHLYEYPLYCLEATQHSAGRAGRKGKARPPARAASQVRLGFGAKPQDLRTE